MAFADIVLVAGLVAAFLSGFFVRYWKSGLAAAATLAAVVMFLSWRTLVVNAAIGGMGDRNAVYFTIVVVFAALTAVNFGLFLLGRLIGARTSN